MSLAVLFEQILAQPAMYVRNQSITRIKSFMDGYPHALWTTEEYDESDVYFGFQSFVEKDSISEPRIAGSNNFVHGEERS